MSLFTPFKEPLGKYEIQDQDTSGCSPLSYPTADGLLSGNAQYKSEVSGFLTESCNTSKSRTAANITPQTEGEAILVYRLTNSIQEFCGVQRSSRKESFEASSIKNTNVGIGLSARF